MSDHATSSLLKSSQSERKRKRNKAPRKAPQTNNYYPHQLNSDISADEADESLATKHQRISMVHSYATQQPKTEYKCSICNKVIRATLFSLIRCFKCYYLNEGPSMWCWNECKY